MNPGCFVEGGAYFQDVEGVNMILLFYPTSLKLHEIETILLRQYCNVANFRLKHFKGRFFFSLEFSDHCPGALSSRLSAI